MKTNRIHNLNVSRFIQLRNDIIKPWKNHDLFDPVKQKYFCGKNAFLYCSRVGFNKTN